MRLGELAGLVGNASPHLVDRGFLNGRVFDIYAPIWTESLTGDGLFDFDVDAEPETAKTLVGFVALKLDFGLFHASFVSKLKIAISALLMLLVVCALAGRRSLVRALSSISDLQEPLAELAKGNLDVQFKPAEHREISEIVEALESTATALGERDARLLRLANHDVLTGLYNRRRFVEELKREVEGVAAGGERSALLFIDLDQFKYVNDTCGHPAGDRLLQNVAEQLRYSVGEGAVVARFGGDEFAALVKGVTAREAKIMADTILSDMRGLVHTEGGKSFPIHCSIGITMIRSGKFNHDELIAQADIACREAKVGGRNQAVAYNAAEREAEQMAADVGWVSQLRQAIDQDSFVLRYQPIVHIASGSTTHHEVLLRMQADNGKFIAPDAFLPAAARFGLMAEIDAWVVKAAIAALGEFQQSDPELRFAVNLSAHAFEAGDLPSLVREQLKANRVPAACMIFEITESLAVRHFDHVEKQIAGLRDLGCQLALDDFGTGYSSFSYLQQLSVDYLKIDGSFVRHLASSPVDQKMVRMIGEIAREARIQTVAEYVQNDTVLALLGTLGVDYAQGNYIGRATATPVKRSVAVPIETRRQKKKRAKRR